MSYCRALMMVFFALSSGCLLHGYRNLRVFTQIKKFVYNYLRIYHHALRNLSKPSVVCADIIMLFSHVAATL